LTRYQKGWLVALLLFWALYLGLATRKVWADEGTVSAPTLGPVIPLSCPFYPGWNLVVPTETRYELAGCLSAIWRYESDVDRWYSLDKSQVFSTELIEFQADKSYWVYR
jgi:hypothetical protein